MAITRFGDLAYVETNQSRETYLADHFTKSQHLLAAPISENRLTAGTEVFKLKWVFYFELLKILSIGNSTERTNKINKLKNCGFDFSKYFYFIKDPDFDYPSDWLSSANPLGISLTPSGGNGNIDFLSLILASRNLTLNDFRQLQINDVVRIFQPDEIQILQQHFNLPNFQDIERNIIISDLNQNRNLQ